MAFDRETGVTDFSRASGAGGLRLSLFGEIRLGRTDDAAPGRRIRNRKAAAVLAYLALQKMGCASRETLAALFWGDSPDRQARASLRQSLRFLRQTCEDLGFDGFVAGVDDVRLDLTRVETDLDLALIVVAGGGASDQFDQDMAPTQLLYGLEDLNLNFGDWIRIQRMQWEAALTPFLRGRLDPALADAAHAAELLIALDPTDEHAHRCLIHGYADDGNTAAALRQYRQLWDLLDHDYDMEPDEETQALIADVKSGGFARTDAAPLSTPPQDPAPPQAVAPQPGAQLPTIGVWTFVCAGPWTGEHFIMEGFRQDLIGALVRFREWIVTEGRSQIDQTNTSQPDYAIEGSYFEIDGTLNLVITLKDLTQNRFIWSERVELSFTSWFGIRTELIRRIAVALNIYLSVDRIRAGVSAQTTKGSIYDRWLQAQDLSNRWRPKEENHAEAALRGLIAEDPRFAPAYASLVQIINARHFMLPGRPRSEADHAEALDLAKRAVEHDPLDTRTQLCLAWSYAMNARYSEASMRFRMAHSLNENDPWTLVSSALGLAYCGEVEAAFAQESQVEQLGLDLSPLHWAYRAGVRFIHADFDGCVRAAEQAENATLYIGGWHAAALAHAGRQQEAEAKAAQFCKLVARYWDGDRVPEAAEVTAWFLDAFPIREGAVKATLEAGLAKAGMPLATPALSTA